MMREIVRGREKNKLRNITNKRSVQTAFKQFEELYIYTVGSVYATLYQVNELIAVKDIFIEDVDEILDDHVPHALKVPRLYTGCFQ